MLNTDEHFMRQALQQAQRAAESGEVPVGCVIVHENRIIAKAHNQRETLQDPTAHAEVIAITAAAAMLGSWRLEDTQMYVTLEPCAMCSGAIILSRIPKVFFGATDPKAGCSGSLMNLLTDSRFNHQPELESGLLGEECGALLTGFFREIRSRQRLN